MDPHPRLTGQPIPAQVKTKVNRHRFDTAAAKCCRVRYESMPDVAVDFPRPTGSAARPPRSVLALLAALAALVIGLTSYLVGAHHEQRTWELTGTAQVGLHEASACIDGWCYGIDDSVHWFDARGRSHDSGWPDCLDRVGSTVTIQFGAVAVSYPDDSGERLVTWVRCPS